MRRGVVATYDVGHGEEGRGGRGAARERVGGGGAGGGEGGLKM